MKKNTTFNFSEEYQRAKDRTKGITAETDKPDGGKISMNPTQNKSSVPKPAVDTKKTGYQTLDQVNAGKEVLGIKQQYETGQNLFHQSDLAKNLIQKATDIRKSNNLSDSQYGSGVTSKDVYEQYEKVYELGNIKKEFEEKNALDPGFASSAEGIALANRAKEIRAKYGLSDQEYGSGVTSDNVFQKAGAIKNLYDVKNEYETGYQNSPEGKQLRERADTVRSSAGLSDETYGAGVTSKELAEYLRKQEASPAYQRDAAYLKYGDTARQLNEEMATELSDEVKMRAILDRVDAEKIAEKQIGGQLDKEIEDSLRYEDELAAQRGSYGQLSYGKRRALKEESLRDNRAARVQQLINSLIAEDRQKATEEYQQNLANKEGRLKALNQRMQQNETDFKLGQQYRSEVAQEDAARQQALYESIKEQYDQAFEMSNALGYITPELSALTGIAEGTPMFKMVEYYGDMEQFYAQLDLEAQRVAIEQYRATHPTYYGGYKSTGNTSGEGGLTWNQAKAIWEKFSSDFSFSHFDQKPNAGDLLIFLDQSGLQPAAKEAVVYAAGFTPSEMENAAVLADYFSTRAILPGLENTTVE